MSNAQNEVRGFKLTGAAATVCGSTNDAVINFASAPTAQGAWPIAGWCTAANDAVSGSSFTFLYPGIYAFSLLVPLAAAGAINIGISFRASGTDLTATPAPTMTSMFGNAGGTISAGGELMTLVCSAVIPIQSSSISTAVVRFHAATAAGGDPTALTTPAGIAAWCTRIGECYG